MAGFYRYDQNLDKYVPMPVELLASEGEEYTAPKITQKFNEVETKTTEILNKVLTDDRYFTVTSSFKQDATLGIEYYVTKVTPKTTEAKKVWCKKRLHMTLKNPLIPHLLILVQQIVKQF